MFGNQKEFTIIIAIIFIAIGLRIYTFSGFVGLDDAEYARFAHQIVNKTFDIKAYSGPPVFPLRIGIIFPASVSFKLFGVSQWSMVLYPLIISIMSILLVYFSTTYLFSSRAGLIAAAIWAVLPLDIYNATKLLPDLPAAFFASLGVVLIIFFRNSLIENKAFILLAGIFTGILFGISWLTKESVFYLFPFCLALIVIDFRRSLKTSIMFWVGVAAGSLGTLIIEMIVYYTITGDLLFRFHEVERNYRQLENGFFTEGSKFGWAKGDSYYKALLKRLFLTGAETIFLNIQFLYLPLLGIIASLYALYWKDKSFFAPFFWLITLFLMFNFSSSSFSSYAPLALFERYLYPILFPSVILTSGLIEKLTHNGEGAGKEKEKDVYRERFFWGVVLAGLLLVLGAYQTFRSIRGKQAINDWTSGITAASAILKPTDKIYTDNISIKGLEFFWEYPKEMRTVNFEGMESTLDIKAGSFVLINQRYIDWLIANAGMWLNNGLVYKKPFFLEDIPPSWKKTWQNGKAVLYKIE